MVRTAALTLVALLCAPAFSAPVRKSPSPQERAFASAKAATIDRMRDPTSVLFKELEFHRLADGSVRVCGLVNGKNAYGGYSGFERFVWVSESKQSILSSDDDPEWLPASHECWHY